MTQNTKTNSERVDWVARIDGGGPNFRLPTDGADIPDDVLQKRICDYYRQVWEAMRLPARLLPTQNGQATHGTLATQRELL